MLKRVLLAAIVGVAVGVFPAPASAQFSDLRQALDFAREKVYPALVNISVVSEDMVGGRKQASERDLDDQEESGDDDAADSDGG